MTAYDLRPLDTETTINIRNRIRVSSFLCIFGVLLYFSISPSMTQTHASWLHMFHILVQPVIFVITLLDNTQFTMGAMIAGLCLWVIDLCVFVLNFISVSRCLSESTASCFDRLYEKTIWVSLAAWFLWWGFIAVSQLYTLNKALKKKDHHEKAAREMAKINNTQPTWNSINVLHAKMYVINVFLLLFDFTQFIVMATQLQEIPLFAIGMIHILIDPYVIFTSQKGRNKNQYSSYRMFYILSAVCNFVVLILLMQMEISTVGKMLSLLITLLFVTTDLLQIMFTTMILNVFADYEEFKRKI
mgnify:CR=1 FL=1